MEFIKKYLNIELRYYQKIWSKILFIYDKFYYKYICKNDYNNYLNHLIKKGYLSARNLYPLKCISCKGKNFESKNFDYIEHILCEYDYVCKNCGTINGHWAYGCWFI